MANPGKSEALTAAGKRTMLDQTTLCQSIAGQPLNDTPELQSAISALEFWRESQNQVIIDVRSPAEYAHGHIPGAVNIPLFDDAERAEIGTIYKNSGRNTAVLRGLRFAGRKMEDLVIQVRHATPGHKTVLVHCWRGGMRSQSVSWLLRLAGMEPLVLEGGYKAFRKFARSFFDWNWQLQVLSGLTGAGKTRILDLVADTGAQVLDLERLANHRGSAFGGIGHSAQPSTEQFENELFAQLDSFEPEQRIWVEDEGNRIGSVVVPQEFYQHLRHSPGIFLESSPSRRVKNLLVDYGQLPIAELKNSILKIRKRLGPQHADTAMGALDNGNCQLAIEIVLAYYDKFYLKAAKAMPRTQMPELPIDELTDSQIVVELQRLVRPVSTT